MKQCILLSKILVSSFFFFSTLTSFAFEEGLPTTRQPWRHFSTAAIVVTQGKPQHAVNDVQTTEGSSVKLFGKFVYGLAHKDLEDEWISAWIRPISSSQWINVGTALSDRSGTATFHLNAAQFSASETLYEYRMIVLGDLSYARGTIEFLTPHQRIVVFDIDGTLTTANSELFDELVWGRDPEVNEGAPAVVKRYDQNAVRVVYLTGRPFLLRHRTQSWLQKMDFPASHLQTTDSLLASLPTDESVGKFKKEYLDFLQDDLGVNIIAAYGDSKTDVCAYAQARLIRSFIIGAHNTFICPGYNAPTAISSFGLHLPQIDEILNNSY